MTAGQGQTIWFAQNLSGTFNPELPVMSGTFNLLPPYNCSETGLEFAKLFNCGMFYITEMSSFARLLAVG